MASFPGSYALHVLVDFCFQCHILQAMEAGEWKATSDESWACQHDSMQGEGEVKVGGEPGSETCAADHEDGAVLYYWDIVLLPFRLAGFHMMPACVCWVSTAALSASFPGHKELEQEWGCYLSTCTALHSYSSTLWKFLFSAIAAKLQALDESYANKVEEETRRSEQALEERMAVFQRDCEGQHRRQLEAEMVHFRERELARMREEERERCESEMRRVREELLGAHRQKLEAVRKMEVETLERLRRKEQVNARHHPDIIILPCAE